MNTPFSSSEILPWLLDLLLQISLLLAVPLLVVFCLPRMAAARKHLILTLGLLGLPLVITTSLMLPHWRLVDLNSWMNAPSQPQLTTPAPAAFPTTQETSSAPMQAPSPTTPTGFEQPGDSLKPGPLATRVTLLPEPTALPLAGGIALIWALGLLGGLFVIGFTWRKLHRLEKTLQPESDARLQSLLIQTLAEAKLEGKDVHLLRGTPGQVPMTWGLWQRFILLPAEAREWTNARALLVLRHEVAHIARQDVATTLAQTLCTLLVWFHPMAWWVWAEAGRAREAACDDAAFGHSEPTSADTFATELLSAVSALGSSRRGLLPPPALAMAAADKAALKRRLASLLDPARQRRPWGGVGKMLMIMNMLALATMISGLAACRKEPATNTPPAASTPAQSQAWAKAPMIMISSSFFDVPLSPELLQDLGLSLGDGQAMVNLGVMPEAQMVELLKKIKNTKGADLLSAPSVTTRSGQIARVEMVREFIYPTEFDPPQFSQPKDGTAKTGTVLDFPLTPTTPTAFEMRPVGIRMEVEPVFLEDIPGRFEDSMIALTLAPEITEFEGFVNYGSPIKASTVDAEGKVQQTTLSENIVNQPVFHTAKMQTSVTLRSRQCVVLGGLSGGSTIGPVAQPDSKESTTPEITQNSQSLPKSVTAKDAESPLKSKQSKRIIFVIVQAKVVER